MTRDISVFVKFDMIIRLFFGKLPQIRTSNFSQNSAATYWRYGGKYYMGFVGNFQQWKNFKNPLRTDKVIAMSLV